jgi:hypothetical protein
MSDLSLNPTQLDLARCPHCGVMRPYANCLASFETNNFQQTNPRVWFVYKCNSCGGVITAAGRAVNHPVHQLFPQSQEISADVPERAREYLKQAVESLSSPAGSVMLCASAVDAMLRAKGLSTGTLYSRIDEAAKTHLITDAMAQWAHQVRLDANEQRHADDSAPLPEEKDASRSIEFAKGLATVLFELPARVTRGLKATTPEPTSP